MPPLSPFHSTCIVLAISHAISAPVGAAIISVNGATDKTVDNAVCTLREAIISANTDSNAAEDTCVQGNGPDVINFSNVSLPANTSITLSSQLMIDSEVIINGRGVSGLTINGGGNDRVFYLGEGSTVAINDLTITGGSSSANGGGIFISSSNFTLINSTVSNNSADAVGGGIFVERSSNVSLVNVTVSGNSAATGGGIAALSNASVSLTNATVTENNGGGIHARDFGSATLTNSLISGNVGSFGDELETDALLRGMITSDGNNLFGSAETFSGLAFYGRVSISASDIVATNDGTGGAIHDPTPLSRILGPLRSNGGTTHTHALRRNSPARDNANLASCPLEDQRGQTRNDDDDACDIGAIEFKPVDDRGGFIVMPLSTRGAVVIPD